MYGLKKIYLSKMGAHNTNDRRSLDKVREKINIIYDVIASLEFISTRPLHVRTFVQYNQAYAKLAKQPHTRYTDISKYVQQVFLQHQTSILHPGFHMPTK